MGYTNKQERNGATGAQPTQMSAAPGPDYTAEVASAIATSTAAGNTRAAEAAALMSSPAGAGVNGHNIGAGGNMFEWDSGLAIMEQFGEMA